MSASILRKKTGGAAAATDKFTGRELDFIVTMITSVPRENLTKRGLTLRAGVMLKVMDLKKAWIAALPVRKPRKVKPTLADLAAIQNLAVPASHD